MSNEQLTPEHWAQISDIAADFLEAADQSDAARDAFLNARCVDDSALRKQVASLLAADKKKAVQRSGAPASPTRWAQRLRTMGVVPQRFGLAARSARTASNLRSRRWHGRRVSRRSR